MQTHNNEFHPEHSYTEMQFHETIQLAIFTLALLYYTLMAIHCVHHRPEDLLDLLGWFCLDMGFLLAYLCITGDLLGLFFL